jgi:hypothetical protein
MLEQKYHRGRYEVFQADDDNDTLPTIVENSDTFLTKLKTATLFQQKLIDTFLRDVGNSLTMICPAGLR